MKHIREALVYISPTGGGVLKLIVIEWVVGSLLFMSDGDSSQGNEKSCQWETGLLLCPE